MVCNGELVRSKPPARHFTLFYLLVAAGGALGGLFVAVVQLSIAVGSTVGGLLFDMQGYRTTFAASAGLLAIASLMTYWTSKATPRI